MKFILVLILSVFPAGLHAAAVTAVGSGNWSDPAPGRWTPAAPGPGDDVTIPFGSQITLDVSATVKSITIRGRLLFSRVSSGTLTLDGGDAIVAGGGWLDMGTSGSPIPAGVQASLILAKGNLPGTLYGLVVESGGNFAAHGAEKTPAGVVSSIAATSLVLPSSHTVGWSVGDTIAVTQTERPAAWVNQTEERVIAGLSGGDPRTVSWATPLSFVHDVSLHVRAENISRNVVVRSSGTDVSISGGDSSYVYYDGGATGSLSWANAEFAYLGTDRWTQFGVWFETNATVQVSSCSFHHGHHGVSRGNTAPEPIGTFVGNVFYANARIGMQGSPGYVLRGNDFVSNGQEGFSGEASVFSGNTAVSNAGTAVYIVTAGLSIASNTVIGNRVGGILAGAPGAVAAGNLCARNSPCMNLGPMARVSGNRFIGSEVGLSVEGGSIIENNEFEGNVGAGIEVGGADADDEFKIVGNSIHDNVGAGIICNAGRCVLVRNEIFANGEGGVILRGNEAVSLRNNVYANLSVGLWARLGSRVLSVQDVFGYDPSGVPAPDVSREVFLTEATHGEFRGARINPSPYFGHGDGSFLSFNQNFSTGTAVFIGERTFSGRTLSFDYADDLYDSTATVPVLNRGAGHGLQVLSTSDDFSAGESVAVRYDGSDWRVEGSVSGPIGVCNGGTCVYPPFTLSFTPGAAAPGDLLSFAVLPASKADRNVQKRLFMQGNVVGEGPRMILPADGGLRLRGASGAPTVVDRFSGSDPYFSIVSSGSFELVHATMSNLDGGGLRLSGAGPVLLASSTFMNLGDDLAARAYVTVGPLASNATFYNMSFQATAGRTNATSYGIVVQEPNPSLRWFFRTFSGGLADDGNDVDDGRRIYWHDVVSPGTPPSFGAAEGAGEGEILLSWASPGDDALSGSLLGGSFLVFRTTDPAAASGATPAQAQVAISTDAGVNSLHAVLQTGLSLGTTYHYRLWGGDEFGNFSALPAAAASQARRFTPDAPQNFVAASTGNTVNLSWAAPPLPGAAYRGTYLLERSSTSASSGYSLISEPGPAATGYSDAGLAFETTYYYRLFVRDNGASPLSSPSAVAVSRTAEVSTSFAALGIGPRSFAVSRTPVMTVTFSKAMDPASTFGAFTLTQRRDALGRTTSVPVSIVDVSSDPAGLSFTLAAPPLEGNSLYELAVSSAARDTFNKAAASNAFTFTTLMDRAVDNVYRGSGGEALSLPAFSMPRDGYALSTAALPPAADAATSKLAANHGDGFRRPVAGGMADFSVFDVADALQPLAAPATVTLSYADANGDGVVDGTSPPVKAGSLRVHWLDEAKSLWQALPGSTVDAVARTVSVQVRHLSAYALIGAPANQLVDAHAYPNPWVAGKGVSEVTFTGLGQVTSLKVYTSDGLLVRELATSDGSGACSWDLKDMDGEPVATGLYLARVASGDQTSVIRVGVVR